MGFRASATNRDHWSTFGNAVAAAARPGFADGLGFVFAAQDPYTGIDLDNVYQSDADEGAEWAHGILERFSDCYLEESPSGKGVKIWTRAKPPRCGKWAIAQGAVEVYDHSRFFAVTGRSNGVKVVTDHHDDILSLIQNLDDDRHQITSSMRTVSGPIPQGQRHNSLVSLAGAMWRRGMTSIAIEAALLITNEQQCDPPYPPEHIRQIITSMERWSR
jgi:primase-polymerase (primpol)-like protein